MTLFLRSPFGFAEDIERSDVDETVRLLHYRPLSDLISDCKWSWLRVEWFPIEDDAGMSEFAPPARPLIVTVLRQLVATLQIIRWFRNEDTDALADLSPQQVLLLGRAYVSIVPVEDNSEDNFMSPLPADWQDAEYPAEHSLVQTLLFLWKRWRPFLIGDLRGYYFRIAQWRREHETRDHDLADMLGQEGIDNRVQESHLLCILCQAYLFLQNVHQPLTREIMQQAFTEHIGSSAAFLLYQLRR